MTGHVTRPGVVVPVRLDPAGLTGPTPGQARGRGWRRVGAGLYVPATTDSAALDQRIVEAVAGCSGAVGVTGWGALAWQGARWFSGRAPDGRILLPVPVALGDRRATRPRPGVVLSEDWLFPDDVTSLDGLPLTCAERSVTWEVRHASSLVAAVRAIDMAAYDDLVDLISLADYVRRLGSRPGARRLRTALGWARENVWSPQEVPLRIAWRRARPRARLLCNPPLFDSDGQHLLTPDLFDPEHEVAGEYDGVVHLDGSPRRRDLDRDALYRDLGIEVVTMMSTDGADIRHFLARLDGAYRRAAERRGGTPAWTLDQPPWWVDTSTVAARRALDEEDRRRWLRRRAS